MKAAVVALIFSVLVPICLLYANLATGKVFRAFATRPWKFFWLSMFGYVPVGLLGLALPDGVGLVLAGVMTAYFLVLIGATVQGLRSTWRRSRRNAAIVGAVGALWIAGAGIFGGVSNPVELIVTALAVVGWLLLMAVATEWLVNRRLAAPSAESAQQPAR